MNDCEKAFSAFLDERIADIRKISEGHINRTYLVNESYVLQCLNSDLYKDHVRILSDNYDIYSNACREKSFDRHIWKCPEWLTGRNGSRFYTDENGSIWRMYRYIPSDLPDDHKYPVSIYEMGRGIGKLHFILKDCTGIKAVPSTAHIHDIQFHYDKYILQNDPKQERIADLDRAIEDGIHDMLAVTSPQDNIIHGDAKCGNMIFQNGEVVGFIDLDTLMEGSVFEDIADCARTMAVDERGRCDMRLVEELLGGYEDGAKTPLVCGAAKLTAKYVSRSRFTLGIRYYTDYLSGEHYFAEERPGQSLARAKELLTD